MSTEKAREIQRRWMRHCPYGRRGLEGILDEMDDDTCVTLAACEAGLGAGFRAGTAALRDGNRGAVVPFLVYRDCTDQLLTPPGVEVPAHVRETLADAMRRCVSDPDVTCGPLRGLIGPGPLPRHVYSPDRRRRHHWEAVLPGTIFCKTRIFDFTMLRYALVEELAPVGDARVLDAGCGAGYGARYLARRARRVTAVEADGPTLDYARRYFDAENIAWVQGDATALVTPHDGYDAFVALELLEHLEDPDALLRRAHRALQPGGVLVLSTPNADARRSEGTSNPCHVREYTRAELKELIEPLFEESAIYSLREGGRAVRNETCEARTLQSQVVVAQKAHQEAWPHDTGRCRNMRPRERSRA